MSTRDSLNAGPPVVAPGTAQYYRAVESAYGEMAPIYDSAVGMNPVAARAKAVAMGRLLRLTKPGSHLLDLGCGPGQEAVALARRGYRVLGIDSALPMVELARQRALGLPAELATFEHLRAAEVGSLARMGRSFDAAYSFFAVLNLEPDVRPVAEGLFGLLPARAPFLVGLLNPVVLFELALYPFAGRLKGFRKASKRPVRLKVSRGGTNEVACFLYPPHQFARICSPWFSLERTESIHLFLPPPDSTMLRFPTLLRGVSRIERRLEARWPFRSLGYFSLMTFRRREARL